MAREARSQKDAARGERFRSICRELFPGQSRASIGERLGGMSGGSVRNWEQGYSIAPDALAELTRLGVSLEFLLEGRGEPMLFRTGPSVGAPELPAPPHKLAARIIGANLKLLRKQRFSGWGGQRRFADFLNITPNDLCVYEYGRSAPSEQRLEEMARRLGMTAEQLQQPLPGVEMPSPAMGEMDLGPLAASERIWRERVDDLKQTVARLQGRLEATEEQNARLEEQNARLREANYVLRNLLYVDDTDEARMRRDRVLERLEPSITQLVKQPEIF